MTPLPKVLELPDKIYKHGSHVSRDRSDTMDYIVHKSRKTDFH